MTTESTAPRFSSRLMPHPMLSLVLLGVWLLLNNSMHPRMVLLGILFGLAIPPFTHAFWPERPRIFSPMALIRFIPVFLWDVVIANFSVAGLILNFRRKLRPSWIVVPLDLTNPFAIVTLANVISLTPGTVSSQLSPDRKTLLVHALDLDDEETRVREIKERYETPLREIFEC